MTEIDALASRVKAKFDTFDLLFVNAGFGLFAPVENTTETVYDEMFNLNAKGPFFAVQKLAPLMNRGGAVVLTTSVANVKGMPGLAAYGAAKAALRSFARVLTAELLPREIRVNAVTPGPIDTPIINKTFSEKDVAAEVARQMLDINPMKRFGTSEEIAKAVPLPRARRDLHDRRRTSGRWGLVATLKAVRHHTYPRLPCSKAHESPFAQHLQRQTFRRSHVYTSNHQRQPAR
jgi:NAD(P)-dependent dehydrogenase (short-subunit alcohol dehydrogenase family)